MKKGINYWNFPAGTSLEAACALAKKAGFDGIEYALAEDGPVYLDMPDKEVLRAKRIALDEGLELTSLATGLYWKYSYTAVCPKERKKAGEICRRQLEIASLLGVDVILVVPGAVRDDCDNPSLPYDAAYDAALQGIAKSAKDAEEIGVTIGIENVWNKFLLSPLETRDFIDKIASERVAMYFDAGNVLLTGFPQQWVRILSGRIKKVHIKEYRTGANGFLGFVDLLAGDLNWPELTKALAEVGYDDYLIAEMGGYKHYQDQLLYTTSGAMDYILGRK